MENLDVYILTSVVVTLFATFGIGIYREFSRMEKDGYEYDPNAKKYGRDALFDLAAKLFENEEIIAKVNKKERKLKKKEKKVIYQAMFKNISDMESDGVYFPEDIKRELIKQKEELTCEYSGLPSTKVYEKR